MNSEELAAAYGVAVETVDESERFIRHAMYCGGQYVMRMLGNSLSNEQYMVCVQALADIELGVHDHD